MIKPLDLEWREITKGMVVKGKVVRLEKFGAFVDIGAERPGLVHISEMTHGYIRTPSEVVKEGDEVEAKVIAVDKRKKKIKLSMKALEEVPEKPAKSVKKEKTTKEELTPPPVEEEHEPTAMEIALREAMERTKAIQEDQTKKERKVALRNKEMEDILSRTIEQKLKSPSK
jgi:predicted RNA-binding protein with RPS1 domain